jgi:hypothetical protein
MAPSIIQDLREERIVQEVLVDLQCEVHLILKTLRPKHIDGADETDAIPFLTAFAQIKVRRLTV